MPYEYYYSTCLKDVFCKARLSRLSCVAVKLLTHKMAEGSVEPAVGSSPLNLAYSPD